VTRRTVEPMDGEQQFRWGSPAYPHPYTVTFDAKTGLWKQDVE
jgi:hypothetical protein